MVRFHAPIARGVGSNPDWGTKIPDASLMAGKKKKKTTSFVCVCGYANISTYIIKILCEEKSVQIVLFPQHLLVLRIIMPLVVSDTNTV